jgi:hypothetical protein
MKATADQLKQEAKEFAKLHGIDFSRDFHTLSFEQQDTLSTLAKGCKYRKPAGYPGSLGRAFFSHLAKIGRT